MLSRAEAQIQTVLQQLQGLTDDELEMGLRFPVVIDDGFSPEVRLDHSLRQDAAREILASRRVEQAQHQPVAWPKTPTFEDLAAGKPTIGQHVDVRQPDGSIFRFHCRVLVEEAVAVPKRMTR